MSQDILSFGLDLDSFSDAKKAKLNEFIKLFETLEKYDGAKINPVLGDGLSAFNSSLVTTNVLLSDLNAKLVQLNTTRVQPQLQTVIKQAGDEAESTAHKITFLGKSYNASQNSVALLGKELTRSLTVLRQIAYILPGIGIAGIFNLAFEAIEKAAVELDVFTDKSTKLDKENTEIDKNLTDLINTYKELSKQLEIYGELAGVQLNPDGKGTSLTVKQNQDIIESNKARGISDDILLQKEVDNATERLGRAKTAITGTLVLSKEDEDARVAQLKIESESDLNILRESYKKVEELTDNLNKVQKEKKFLGIGLTGDLDKAKADLETEKSAYDYFLAEYNQKYEKLNEYINATNELNKKQQELEKFNSDQSRKLLVDETKDNIAVKEEEYKKTQQLNTSTHNEVLRAIEEEYEAKKKLNNIERINVTGVLPQDVTPTIPLNPNLSATPDDKLIAFNKQADKDKQANDDKNTAIHEENVKNYQREIKAKKDFDNDILESDAITQKAISDNLEKTLGERLIAYSKYIVDKKQIEENSYNVDIQEGSAFKGDKTSLRPDELKTIKQNRDSKDNEINANVEKESYDIAKTYLDKKLADVIEENKSEETANTDAYAKALNDETALFDKKLISYKQYKAKIEEIRRKYSVDDDKQNIGTDTDNINRIEDNLESDQLLASNTENGVEEKTSKVKTAKSNFDINPTDSNKTELNEEQAQLDEIVGANKAANDAILKDKEDLNESLSKLDKDRLKEAEDNIVKESDINKAKSESTIKIAEAVFNFVKKYIAAEYQLKEEQVERIKDANDEQYNGEIDAINRSSLSSKDKAALDIQLSEQKRENDKVSQSEELKLKRDVAEADRDLSIVHIIWDTAEAVAAAQKLPPPFDAIKTAEAVSVGVIELATVVATPLPSYSLGAGINGRPVHPGGIARYGEDGTELIKEPYKSPYLVHSETISYLPEGTSIIPIKNSPEFSENKEVDNWEQTRWLAKQLKKNIPQIKNEINNVIKVDLRTEYWKAKIYKN